ncbi:MAG: hypothetical protein DDT41_00520 [candidate division WS2 bacterium]|nr:hypothetical protein [Candidatus Psychracetigena formicireducens]
MLDVDKQRAAGNSGRKIRRVREGRELIAKIRAGHHGAGYHASGNVQPDADTDQGDTHGAGSTPRGAGSQRDDAADEERSH